MIGGGLIIGVGFDRDSRFRFGRFLALPPLFMLGSFGFFTVSEAARASTAAQVDRGSIAVSRPRHQRRPQTEKASIRSP